MHLVFSWDPAKAAANLAKHGVAFEEALTVFGDPLAWVFPDDAHSAEERRHLMIGASTERRLLVLSFTERGGAIRIISARPANPQERRKHEEAHD